MSILDSIFRLLAAQVVMGLLVPAIAADLPTVKQQVDSTARAVGTGTCATSRVGTWLVDGGFVVELRKPVGNCRFETLDLVVDGERIPMASADDGFYRGRRETPRGPLMLYEWYRSESGRVFFKTSKSLDPSKIQGILEPSCSTQNCLNEPGALEQAK